MNLCKNREQFTSYLYDKFTPTNVCEVGVQCGLYSKHILQTIPSIEKIYLVDLWKRQEKYDDHANVSDITHESFYQQTLNNIKQWKNRAVILRGFSTEMCHSIPDGSLDWIYIDARHDYVGCTQDINSYWPKLKIGGVMSGHDFMTAPEMKQFDPEQDWSICVDGTNNPGAVKQAVIDFANKYNKQISTTQEIKCPSWYFVK